MILDRKGGRGQCQTENVRWGLCKRSWRRRIWKRGIGGRGKFLLMRGFCILLSCAILECYWALLPLLQTRIPFLQDCLCKTVSFVTKWFVFKSQCSKFNLVKWKEVLGHTHVLFKNYSLIGYVDKGKSEKYPHFHVKVGIPLTEIKCDAKVKAGKESQAIYYQSRREWKTKNYL